VFGGSRRLATTAKAAALGAAALVTAAWYLAVRHVSLAAYAPPGHVIDPHAQISFIVHHPLGYTKVLARTIFDNGPESYFVPGFVQAMGFFRTVSRGSANAPLGLVILATILLFSAYRADVGRPRPGVSTLTYARALLPLALAAVAVVVIFSVLWWQWTAVGSLTVREIQGRYFLPLMGLPVLTVALLRTKPIGLSRWRWLVIGSLVMLAYTALKVWVLFY
jgi:uncharacterized membrane protein